MSLDAYALVDAGEVKLYLGIDKDKDMDNDLIEQLINSASQFILTYCDRYFIAASDYDDEFYGDGTDEYYTEQAPLTNTVSTIYYWSGTAWTALTGVTFDQKNAKGLLYFTDGSAFLKSLKYKITYNYGYALADVPADLKHACILIVNMNKKMLDDKLIAISSKNFPDGTSISFDFDKIPANVLATLNHYKRFHE